jgi:uncharacterized Zn finger protein (UPF0148 family)
MTFCTTCGTQFSGEKFCTSCGTSVNELKTETPVTQSFSESEVKEDFSEKPTSVDSLKVGKSKKKIYLRVSALLLILGVGIGAFFGGKYSVDVDKAREDAYNLGFSSGETRGYSRGSSDGYTVGFTAGCEDVFERANYANYLTKYNIYGYGFGKFPGSVYVSKTNC